MGNSNFSKAKKKIEKVNRSVSTVLNLYGLQLTSVPEEIRELHLFDDQLTSFPSEIGFLTNLTELHLSFNNQLKSLPEEIGRITNLTILGLNNNQLKSVPSEIGFLTKLTFLNLSNNQLRSLPSEIGLLGNLRKLFLHNNQLRSVPSEIGFLTKLTFLNLTNNQLKSLPEEIRFLTNLKYVFLRNNPELIYPPCSMLKSGNVAKEVVEFCQTHPGVYTRRERRKNMWKNNRLMYIAQHDLHCTKTFGNLPVELIAWIESFCISEPYIEPREETGVL